MRSGTTESIVRGLLAAVVIYVTWNLTRDGGSIADQWQAVFLMVIGYYFKDRPQAERFGTRVFEGGDAAWLVLTNLRRSSSLLFRFLPRRPLSSRRQLATKSPAHGSAALR